VDVTRSEKAFMVLIRNAMFGVLRALARGDFATALAGMTGVAELELAARMAEYFEHCGELAVDPRARHPQYLRVVSKDQQALRLEQTLCDAEEPTDWALNVKVDLAESRIQGHPVLLFESLEPVGGT
jgi:bifunctional ADP-heptose synthase (sugar kinase/adenylyltransferase)